jgi:hypothetical protein
MMGATAAGTGMERRSERRIDVRLPVRVRGANRTGRRFDELTTSENVCRNGVAFATLQELLPGTNLGIEIAPAQVRERPAGEFTTRGRVAYVKPGSGADQYIVGVQFTGPRFNRVFRRESA